MDSSDVREVEGHGLFGQDCRDVWVKGVLVWEMSGSGGEADGLFLRVRVATHLRPDRRRDQREQQWHEWKMGGDFCAGPVPHPLKTAEAT
jgi:predicted Rdx family selenoprotein